MSKRWQRDYKIEDRSSIAFGNIYASHMLITKSMQEEYASIMKETDPKARQLKLRQPSFGWVFVDKEDKDEPDKLLEDPASVERVGEILLYQQKFVDLAQDPNVSKRFKPNIVAKTQADIARFARRCPNAAPLLGRLRSSQSAGARV